MELNIDVVEPKLFAGAAADEIISVIAETIAEKGRASVVLAGGSTPAAIYRLLSRPPRVSECDWSKVTMYLGDERWVPAGDTQSNLTMVNETLLANLPKPGPKVVTVDTSLPTVQDSARDYEQRIREAEGLSADQAPAFDLVLLGMGEDGHTLSLFPSEEVARAGSQSTELCRAAENPATPRSHGTERFGRERVSMTERAVSNASRIIFLVSGEGKAGTVRRVLELTEPAPELPASLYLRAANRVTWLLDTAAGKLVASRAGETKR